VLDPLDPLVTQPLVRTLAVIMFQEGRARAAKRSLPEEDHPVQALGLDRQHKPLRESVAVRNLEGAQDDVHADALQGVLEPLGELGVPAKDQEPMIP